MNSTEMVRTTPAPKDCHRTSTTTPTESAHQKPQRQPQRGRDDSKRDEEGQPAVGRLTPHPHAGNLHYCNHLSRSKSVLVDTTPQVSPKMARAAAVVSWSYRSEPGKTQVAGRP